MIVHAGQHATLCYQGQFWQNGACFWKDGHSGVDFTIATERAKITCEECAKDANERIIGTPLTVLDLDTRARKCFENNLIFTVEYVNTMTDGELLRIPNFGRVSLNAVRNLIAQWRTERMLAKESLEEFWPHLPL